MLFARSGGRSLLRTGPRTAYGTLGMGPEAGAPSDGVLRGRRSGCGTKLHDQGGGSLRPAYSRLYSSAAQKKEKKEAMAPSGEQKKKEAMAPSGEQKKKEAVAPWEEQKDKEARVPWGAQKRQVTIGDDREGERHDPVVYKGPFSDTLKKVKIMSLTSCCLSLLTGPAITFFTAPQTSVILKGGVASLVVMLSASTTAALHWFTGPYVRRLTWKPGSREIEVEIFSWISTTLTRTIQLSDVRPPKTNRPFVSFSANGQFYFVDPEKFPHKELLKRLTFYKK